MLYIASFDIGTTLAKGVLVSQEAKPLFEKSVSIHTIQEDNRIEQEAEQWFEAVIVIAQEWFAMGIRSQDIALVTFSGQMQDCIPIDQDGSPVRTAILYADGRAGKQAEQIIQELGNTSIHQLSANHMDGTLTFPKIMWIQQEEPEIFERSEKFLISSKDYVIRKLTGSSVTDPTSAATTGLMNAQNRQWETDWLTRFDIPVNKLPVICSADEVVGSITEQAAKQTGFAMGTPVLCGIGDAGAATMGAGVFSAGEMYAYLGTTGWVATPVNEVSAVAEGVFHLAYINKEQYLAIAPIMNAGNAHKWALSVFGNNQLANEDHAFEELEKLMKSTDRSNSELLFLPYLNGERCPVQDSAASGCFIGIRPMTTPAEMSCAVLEGVAMAMRQVMELVSPYGDNSYITLIGGGSKSENWNQIIADVFNRQVLVPHESQYLPSMGAAALGFIQLGWESSYFDFSHKAFTTQPITIYLPNEHMVKHYEQKYEKYIKLYPTLKEIFAL